MNEQQAQEDFVLSTVGDLARDFAEAVPASLALPAEANMPVDFLITRFQPYGWGPGLGDGMYMHYYHPVTKQRTYRYVTKATKLKVLTGARAQELKSEWHTTAKTRLGDLGRRLVCTYGTDPEVFVVDKDGQVIPAWTYLPDKKTPQKYVYNNRTGTVYWDGFQAEFTTAGTDTCLLWVSDNIQAGLKAVHEAAKKVGGKLTIENVVPVNPDILQSEAIEHVQFGCAPSYNAYGLRGNIEDGRNVPFRFAGGHLHFGIAGLTKVPEEREKTVTKYVKALDKVLAVACVSMLGQLDNPIRRQFYGQPGEFRMPPHGFEYRTLSNSWMCHPLAMNMVFDLGRSVAGLADEHMLDGWQSSEEETIEIVMNNDVARAREVLDRNKDMFKSICKVITGPHYYNPEHLDLAYKTWSNGIDSVVKDPKDIVGNWNLDGFWVLHGDGPGKNWEKAYYMLAASEKV